MDPLVLLDQAVAEGKVPRKIATKVRNRMKLVAGAVSRVEKGSGLAYPLYYIEPVLPASRGAGEYGQLGILFARVVPTTVVGALTIFVQFSAALVAFGSKGTIEAVAAHEFTHYVDLVRRLSSGDVASDERETSLFGASHADPGRTVPPKLLYSDKALVSLISRKFKVNLVDNALNRKVEKEWVAKNLPIRYIAPEENVVRLGMDVVSKTRFDPGVLRWVSQAAAKVKG